MTARGDTLPVVVGPEPASGHWWGRRPGEASTLARAAVASLGATLLDGLIYHLALTAMPGPVTRYAAAAALGAVLGAITNFTLNRWWAFRGQMTPVAAQALRYLVGSALTLLVLQGVLWLLVERTSIAADRAWLPAKIVTWAAFSYPYQRLLVFAGARR